MTQNNRNMWTDKMDYQKYYIEHAQFKMEFYPNTLYLRKAKD